MKTPAKALAEALALDRAKYEISQEKIADELHVTQQAVSGWESGTTMPRGPRLQKLGEFFPQGSATRHLVEQLRTGYRVLGLPPEPTRAPIAIGDQSAGDVRAGEPGPPPPRRDDFERPGSSHIKSFELPKDPQHPSDLYDAIARAQHGVTFARQVLDDAANQLARALSQLPKA